MIYTIWFVFIVDPLVKDWQSHLGIIPNTIWTSFRIWAYSLKGLLGSVRDCQTLFTTHVDIIHWQCDKPNNKPTIWEGFTHPFMVACIIWQSQLQLGFDSITSTLVRFIEAPNAHHFCLIVLIVALWSQLMLQALHSRTPAFQLAFLVEACLRSWKCKVM